MHFKVALGPSSPNMNASSRRRNTIPGTAERYSETSYMQTPEEHQALLDKYKGVKGLPAALARALGEEEERRSPRYWKGDTEPRYGGSTPSSSFITDVNFSPGIDMVTLTMKNGQRYSYPLSNLEAGKLINSNSLGAFYNKNLKLGRSKIPVSVTSRSGNLEGPTPIMLGGTRSGLSAPTAMAAAPVALGALGVRAGLKLLDLLKQEEKL